MSIFQMNLNKTMLSALALTAFISINVNAEPLPIVEVSEVKKERLTSEFVGHGTVYGKQNVVLTSGVPGLLTFVAEPGQEVNKGDVVAKVDLLPLQLQQAEQKALLKRAEISLKYQKKEMGRLEALAKVDATARSAFDQIMTEVELAASDIEIAKIRLQQLQDQVNRAVVKAPFKGIVSQRHVKAGTDVNRAADLITLLDTEQQEVRVYVPMRYLPYVKKGQALTLNSGQLELAQQAVADITSVIPVTDTRSQTFEVRAELKLTDLGKWATGQLVDVTLPIVQNKTATLVDRDALLLRADGTYVIKVSDEAKAEKLKVKVAGGQSELVAIEVIDGDALKLGDRVAIRGAERIKTGQEVDIKKG
jgi:RND family efflux transporter MFP subunit